MQTPGLTQAWPCFRVSPRGYATNMEWERNLEFLSVQAEAGGLITRFALSASSTTDILEDAGADICPVTDRFVFSLSRTKTGAKIHPTIHAKASIVAKIRHNQADWF